MRDEEKNKFFEKIYETIDFKALQKQLGIKKLSRFEMCCNFFNCDDEPVKKRNYRSVFLNYQYEKIFCSKKIRCTSEVLPRTLNILLYFMVIGTCYLGSQALKKYSPYPEAHGRLLETVNNLPSSEKFYFEDEDELMTYYLRKMSEQDRNAIIDFRFYMHLSVLLFGLIISLCGLKSLSSCCRGLSNKEKKQIKENKEALTELSKELKDIREFLAKDNNLNDFIAFCGKKEDFSDGIEKKTIQTIAGIEFAIELFSYCNENYGSEIDIQAIKNENQWYQMKN